MAYRGLMRTNHKNVIVNDKCSRLRPPLDYNTTDRTPTPYGTDEVITCSTPQRYVSTSLCLVRSPGRRQSRPWAVTHYPPRWSLDPRRLSTHMTSTTTRSSTKDRTRHHDLVRRDPEHSVDAGNGPTGHQKTRTLHTGVDTRYTTRKRAHTTAADGDANARGFRAARTKKTRGAVDYRDAR